MLSVFHGLAEVYLAGGNVDAFKSVLREIGQIDPQAAEKFNDRTKNFLQRGHEHLKAKKHRFAKFEFEAAIYLDKNNIPAHVGMG